MTKKRQKNNEQKNWFYEKIKNNQQILARLTKKKIRETQTNKRIKIRNYNQCCKHIKDHQGLLLTIIVYFIKFTEKEFKDKVCNFCVKNFWIPYIIFSEYAFFHEFCKIPSYTNKLEKLKEIDRILDIYKLSKLNHDNIQSEQRCSESEQDGGWQEAPHRDSNLKLCVHQELMEPSESPHVWFYYNRKKRCIEEGRKEGVVQVTPPPAPSSAASRGNLQMETKSKWE